MAAEAQYRTVHVRGSEPGKGTAVSRGRDCFVITAAHVVGDPDATVVGEHLKTSRAIPVIRDTELDLAVLKVLDAQEICGADYYLRFDLANLLAANGDGVLRVREEDGSQSEVRLSLAPPPSTAPDRIVRRLTPPHHFLVYGHESGDALGEGHSGAMVFVAGQPAGILTRVFTTGDAGGRILRIDRISSAVAATVPLELPSEERARLDDQIAGDMLIKNTNFTRTADFCLKLWQLGKWIARPEETLTPRAGRRSAWGGDQVDVESMLFPGATTVVTFEQRDRSLHRDARTLIGFVPRASELDPVWRSLEGAVDRCLNTKGQVEQIRLRSGLRREKYGHRTMWEVERTGRMGVSTEDANVWLDFSGREITLRVWTIQ
jgi:hypothetical protein